MNRSKQSSSISGGDESLNQSPFFTGHNAFRNDPVLLCLCKNLPDEVINSLEGLGKWTGSAEANELARLANTEIPKLKTHNAKGNRLDVVEFHPAWHALMEKSVSFGLHCSVWDEDKPEKGHRNFVRAVRYILMAATDCGHLCPMTMTNASVGALKAAPDLLAQWLPKIVSRQYDSSQKPAMEKTGVQIGMGMTEKQGGTDLRANISKAKEDGNRGWRINGHKWFMSAPMNDAFLILAYDVDNSQEIAGEMATGGGQPSCFLVPRLMPDGSKNGLNFMRLKDKLGNRSNASSEVEFNNSLAMMVGKPGKGLRVILEMVTLTRLDCATASAGLMRAALAEAVFHCRHREDFGKKLIDQPIMSRVLADMSLDVAGAVALSLRLTNSFDQAPSNEAEAAYARLMTPVIKYWVCKSAPILIGEAMECLGGNGYVEDGNLARQYREAPVNSIWEGSGNVMCLDVLRVLKKNPEILETVLDMLAADLGDAGGQLIAQLRYDAAETIKNEGLARIFVEKLALSAAAAELFRSVDRGLAQAFIATRLEGKWRATYGMLPSNFDAGEIIEFTCRQINLKK